MKVFLDIDGVLVDFRRGVCEVFQKPNPSENWHFWENWEGVSSKIVDAICDQEFWRRLRWTRDGQVLLYGWGGIMERFDDITLLTTPMPNPNSWTGKFFWIKENLPARLLENIIMLNGSKAQLAKPDTLLIDDKDDNVDEFIEAGGQAILVPRPWNKLSFIEESAMYVKQQLEKL